MADIVMLKRRFFDPRDAFRLKRATAAFMGPCQGKYCAAAMRELIVELGGDQEAWPSRPAVRSPLFPVYMGELTDPDDTPAGG